MFHPLTYDRKQRTLLACFSGALTERDLADCDLASLRSRRLYGPTGMLLDFTDVDSVAVTTAQFVSRGVRPPVMGGQACVMVANGMLFGLLRMFGAYQSGHSRAPIIVRTLAEAYGALGVRGFDFQPVDFPVPLVSPLARRDHTYVSSARAVAHAL